MSPSVMTSLLNKATNGNQLLEILDAIVDTNSAEVIENDTCISIAIPTLDPVNFWGIKVSNLQTVSVV